MLAAGAYNYLVKGVSPARLVEAIRSDVGSFADGVVRRRQTRPGGAR